MPTKNPILVHLPASLEALSAPAISPVLKRDSTLAALTMPTMPKGKQQNNVTRIDSTSHVFGGAWGVVMFSMK